MNAVYIIPCGAEKLDHAAPVAELYTGGMFKLALAAARAACEEGDVVLVLSALHGLVRLDDVLAPYDVRMGQPGSVSRTVLQGQLVDLDLLDADIYAMLPRAYFAALDGACRELGVYPADVYEADTAGIGEQRHTCVVIRDAA